MPGLKERAKTLIELLDGAKFLFAERPLAVDAKAASILDAGGRAHIARMIPRLAALADWNAASLEAAVRVYSSKTNQARRRRAAAARRAHRAGGVAGNFRCFGSTRPGGKPRPPARPGGVRAVRHVPPPPQPRNTIIFGQRRPEAHGHINYWPRKCSVLQVGKDWSGSCHKTGCSTISRVS